MILLLNNKEEIIEVVNDTEVYRNDETLRLTDENYVSYMLSAETKYLPKSLTDQVSYVMVGKDTNYQAYFVSKFQTNNNRTTITGVSAIIEQLRKTIVPRMHGTMPLSQALVIALRDTDITLMMQTETIDREVYIDLNYVSAWDAIKELSHYYGFEIDFNVEYTSADEQSDAYVKRIRIRDSMGTDQPDEAIVYGYNAKSFTSDYDRTETVTALYGFGKAITETQRYKDWKQRTEERLRELHGRHWQNFMPDVGFDEDNPPRVDMSDIFNVDKPVDQLYFGVAEDSPEMRMLGIWDKESQSYNHKFGSITFNDLEEPIDIYVATKNELQKRLKEDVYYKVVVDGLNVNIGDTVRIGSTYDASDNTDYGQARVIELIRDNMLNKNRDIRIGEHITPSRNRQQRENSEGSRLVNSPSVSTFGPSGNRGSLSGIDDIIDGSWTDWDDLDGFGDWDGGFGNNGLDFDTSTSGLNDPDGLSTPEDPDIDPEPEPEPEDGWTEDQEDYPGVVEASLAIVPNVMSETAIKNVGMASVNYDAINNWDSLVTHDGVLERNDRSTPLDEYRGLATEIKTHYRIDGTIEQQTEVVYIIGYPNDTISDIVTPKELENAGIDTDNIDFNMTVEALYEGNYTIPHPEAEDYVFDDVNGLNILAENFVLIPYDLSDDQAGSIVTRAVDLSKHTEDTHLVTSLYNSYDIEQVTHNLSGPGLVTAVNVEIHHREDGVIADTNVAVMAGSRHRTLGQMLDNSSKSGISDRYNDRHDAPIDNYFDASLLDLDRTLGDIYDELATTYES